MDKDKILHQAVTTLTIEAQAITQAKDRLGDAFTRAVEILLQMPGHAVVCGIGKSGAVARKLASTLASTGTPAFFMHPVEALHGDLGMVTEGAVAIILSNSGESEEVLAVLPEIKRRGVPIIAICGKPHATLAKEADVVLDAHVESEACPLGLAPTASCIVQMALGDALAAAAMQARGFTAEDFAASHPAGVLGRRVLLRVKDLMHKGDENPVVTTDAKVEDALLVMTQAAIRGAVSVVDDRGVLCGIFTDGMLRVLMQQYSDRNLLMSQPISRVMATQPTTCRPDMLAAEAARIIQQKQFDNLPVIDEQGRAVGMLDIQDLVKAGLV